MTPSPQFGRFRKWIDVFSFHFFFELTKLVWTKIRVKIRACLRPLIRVRIRRWRSRSRIFRPRSFTRRRRPATWPTRRAIRVKLRLPRRVRRRRRRPRRITRSNSRPRLHLFSSRACNSYNSRMRPHFSCPSRRLCPSMRVSKRRRHRRDPHARPSLRRRISLINRRATTIFTYSIKWSSLLRPLLVKLT